MVTLEWFFAAALKRVTPPISIFSTASSTVTVGFETVSTNGYKLQTTILIISIFSRFKSSWSEEINLKTVKNCSYYFSCKTRTTLNTWQGTNYSNHMTKCGLHWTMLVNALYKIWKNKFLEKFSISIKKFKIPNKHIIFVLYFLKKSN